MNKLGVLEGILFVVGDEGINFPQLCEIMEIKEEEADAKNYRYSKDCTFVSIGRFTTHN